MYLEFYGLKEFPFEITANPSFFYESQRHKEAFSCLFYGIRFRKGIIQITGDVGTGKTTICKYLLSKLPQGVKTSFILNPYFSDVQLLEAIVEDFGVLPPKKTRLDIVNALNKFLLEINMRGENAVLIIDEAQNLTPRQLEQIRLLSNLETDKFKLLQIILVGQPELEKKLSDENLRQIAQRISVKYRITPLLREEIPLYINHRLKVASSEDTKVRFEDECMDLIYNYSQGIPRKINILCDRALLAGFIRETYIINASVIEKCIEDLGG